jgi:hypothetical protein
MADRLVKRRWCQFSLRTLFVVVTLICIWLGNDLSRIVERRQIATWVAERGGTVVNGGDNVRYARDDFSKTAVKQPVQLSWRRRMLGDIPLTRIELPESTSTAQAERAAKAFPEADFVPYERWSKMRAFKTALDNLIRRQPAQPTNP